MFFEEIILGLWRHRLFLFYNTAFDMAAGIFVATVLYPFLSKKLKERYYYGLLVFFPCFFGSVFPDAMFILSTLIEKHSLDGIFYSLAHGGEVYSTFHFHLPIVMVIPTTFCIIMLTNRMLKKRYAGFPKWGLLLACMLSLITALMHVFLGTVGF